MTRRQDVQLDRHGRPKERGLALVVTMMLIAAMLGLGMTIGYYTSSGTSSAANLIARQKALNAAQSGVQHAKNVLSLASNTSAGWNPFLVGQQNSLDDVPGANKPSGKGAILYDGVRALVNYSYPQGTATNYGSYTVWIRTAQTQMSNGIYTQVDATNPVVVVRVAGIDPAGNAQVILEGAMSQYSLGGGGSLDDFVFGKNVDPYGSNSAKGAVRF